MKRARHSTYDMRERAVKALLAGESVSDISASYGFHRSCLYRWLERYYKRNRLSDLEGKSRSGRPRKAMAKSIDKLMRALKKPASYYGFETDFWTSRRVIELGKRNFKIELSQPSMWRRLREAGLTYKKPEKRYFGQDKKLKERWIKREIPKIKRAVKKYRAILYFEDEASISLAPVLGKTWSPKGETPIQQVTGKRGSISAMSAISSSGVLIFTLHDKRIASNEIIKFFDQMLKHHPRRHLVVVIDQAPPHTSKKTKLYIESKARLHVFYLPPYSPELNPDEKVWNYLKNEELKSHCADDKKQLKKLANKKLRKMSKDPALLKALFFRSCVAELLN